ncbi:DEAD-domain-containing protein [Neoconidiobolus thromboides FSU 785]|nr:DEAD-domain-containing protein [Neoconidiobolus thromboides FSU 785]
MADTKVIDQNKSFNDLGLDDRLLRAVAKLGHVKPTLIQSSVIPLALAGKDILARARTGSGKTLTYLLPILQNLLLIKENENNKSTIKAMILVPTRELCEQVSNQLNEILIYCGDIKHINLSGNVPDKLLKTQLKELPSIVIGTPSKILSFLQNKSLNVKTSLQQLIIDEADLVLSFGYEQDLKQILTYLPKACQSFLLSATINKDIENLKQLILRNPVVLKLKEDETSDGTLSEYSIKCTNNDKFLLLYVILKLQLIKGKCLIFVNEIETCYKLKLFLEKFGIRSCALNSELPLNSRYHIIEEFNKGIYDYIIASDEQKYKVDKDSDEEEENSEEEENKEERVIKKRKTTFNSDKEYGVSRGIDFKSVAAVINFDFPISIKSYTHRIGRTARGGKSGIALSLISTSNSIEEAVFNKVSKSREQKGSPICPYEFDMKQIEGFRYRCEDAERMVTKLKIKEARVKELKNELMNSEKLKAHFEDRPKDLEFLRHDKPLMQDKNKEYLKTVPSYLIPKIASVNQEQVIGDNAKEENKKRKGIKFENKHRDSHRKNKRRHDPLKTFSTKLKKR